MLRGEAKEIWKRAQKESYEGKRTLAEVGTDPSPKEIRGSVKKFPKIDLEI